MALAAARNSSACRANLDRTGRLGKGLAGPRPGEYSVFLKVSRSGGFAGLKTSGELDTSGEPDAEVLEAVAVRLIEQPPGTGRPQPDRYVYRLELSAGERVAAVVVAEQDLDQDAAWLLDRVLTRE
jgi:hypothetical protein